MDNKVRQAEKEILKNKVDIVALFASLGVQLEKKGTSWMGNCPFHEDKTPSLSVNQEKGLYNCFGCGESGDVFNLVMRVRKLGFPEAVSYLENFVATNKLQTSATSPRVTNSSATAQGPITSKVSLIDVLSSYRRELEASREAIDYLRGRGLYQGANTKAPRCRLCLWQPTREVQPRPKGSPKRYENHKPQRQRSL